MQRQGLSVHNNSYYSTLSIQRLCVHGTIGTTSSQNKVFMIPLQLHLSKTGVMCQSIVGVRYDRQHFLAYICTSKSYITGKRKNATLKWS